MSIIIKKCLKCGATVDVLHDCTCENCGIKCCGEEMFELKPNTADASSEKHLPVAEINGEEIVVSVPHVMDDDHYIEWVAIEDEAGFIKKTFKPGDKISVKVPYKKGMVVYSYCNKHGLWSTDIQ